MLALALLAFIGAAAFVIIGPDAGSASLPAPVAATKATAEDAPLTVTLAATYIDGESGCTDLALHVANATSGTLGDVSLLPCAEGSQLSSGVDAAATEIPVITSASFPETGSARIGGEIITYAGMTANSLTGVTRGTGGTAAVPHAAGVTVSPIGAATGLVQQNLSDVDATLLVTGISLSFPATGLIAVDDEIMAYGSFSEVDTNSDTTADATQFTVARGALASTPEAHLSGARLFQVLTNQTTVSEAINASQSTIPVASIAGLASPDGFAQIDSEVIFYTGLGADAGACGAATPPCLTGVSRAARTSSAAAHSADAPVFQMAAADSDTATVDFAPSPEFFSLSLTLGADIGTDDTILQVTDPGFVLNGAIASEGSVAIGDEVIAYTGVGDTSEACAPAAAPCLTGLSRGAGGTVAAAHLATAAIYEAFFTFTAGNGSTSAPVVVGVNVTPVNDPPVATDQELQVTPDTPQDITVEAADIDGDSGTHAAGDCQVGFTVQTPPSHGTLGALVNNSCVSAAPNTDGTPNSDSVSVLYSPETGYTGDDSFEAMVCDDGGCDTATMTLHVQEPTPSPTPSPSPTPVIQRADLNCDFAVDAGDALAILEMLAGIPQPTPAGCPPVTE